MFDGIVYNFRKFFKKPFKVGLIAANYFGKYTSDGVAVHVYRLSRELSNLGCEVHVFTRGPKNQIRQKYVGEGKVVVHEIKSKIEVETKDLQSEKRLSYALFEMTVAQEISKEQSIEKFDVLHTHNVGGGGAFISKHFNEIPWVHTFHSLEQKRLNLLSQEEKKYVEVAKWMETVVEYADAHVAVSSNLKKEVLKHYQIPKDKIRVIPNAVCPEMFYPKANMRKDKRVGYVGRFSLEKGIDKLPKIMEGVLEESGEAIFEIIAPINKISPTLKKVETQIDCLIQKYPERIIWHKEAIAREKLVDFYNRCMILIQPSRYESFGLTVLEAMACGCVPLVSNRGGLPEVVDNAGESISLKIKIFIRETLKLLKDYRLRERYNRRAIERVKLFDWKDVGMKTLNLYKRINKKIKLETQGKKDPKVSVIMPAYNAEKFIEEAIKSVLNQDYPDFELIVVNDAPTDKTKKIVGRLAKEDERIIVINNKNNLGKASSVNRAFKIARGNYLVFLDADDLFTPGRLKKQVAYISRNKKIDLIYGDFQKLFPDGRVEFRKSVDFSSVSEPLEKLKKIIRSNEKFKYVCRIFDEKDYIPACSVMFRRKIIDKGIVMDSKQRCEDYDFWFQIIGAGYCIKKMPRIITYTYRIHPNQKSKNVLLTSLSEQKVIDKAKRGAYFK